MALVRLAAEATVLLLLILAPIVIFCLGKFPTLPISLQFVLPALCLISLVILPAYGFTTIRVKIDDSGISTLALFQKQFVEWGNITQLSMKSNWGFQRYVIATKDKDNVSFPLLLNNLKELVGIIRSRIPNSGRKNKAQDRIFQQSFISVCMQFCQLAIGYIFAALLWSFYISMVRNSTTSSDSVIVLVFCLAITAMLLCRTFLIIFMPVSIVLGQKELKLKTCFFEKTIVLNQLTSLYQNIFLLPNGIIARANKHWFYISCHLNDFDELEEELIQQKNLAAKI